MMKRVTPIINELLAGWKLIPVSEQQQNVACKVLGEYCGIDYLLMNNEHVYGLASKVQYGKNYRTFTVSKSEYARYNEALEAFTLMPYYTMQGYVNDGEIVGLALVRTPELLSFIHRGLAEERGKLYVCSWDALKSAGYDVREYSNEDDSKQENLAKTLHELWHEAYQQYLADTQEEENCADCAMREACEGLSAILGTSK